VEPARPAERIEAIDALRGFALIGILFINITTMGGTLYSEQPDGAPDLADPDWVVWLLGHLFVYGSMRGVFSILFGASALLFLQDPSRSPRLFLIRCFWLLWFGVLNATLLLWPGDILLPYAIASPVILLFMGASPRRLVGASLILLVMLSAWAFWEAVSQTPETGDAAAAAAALAEERAARLGDYLANLQFMSEVTLDWTLTPGLVWWIVDAGAFMLLGMALFRTGVLSGASPTSVYVLLAVAGMGLGLPIRAWEAMLAWPAGGEFPAVTALTFQFGRLGVTLGWIGLFMLAWRFMPWRIMFAPLSALGRMAFTGYLGQSMIAAILFSGFGLALWGRLSWVELWALVPLIMFPMALAFMAWLRCFRMGPLEWTWRYLTFGRAPGITRR